MHGVVPVPCLGLFALVLVACTTDEQAHVRSPDSSLGTGLSNPTPMESVPSPVLPGSASSSNRPLEPETGIFDPDGYYFPRYGLTIAQHFISWLEIGTIEYYYDGSLHYDNPRMVPATARLGLETGNEMRSRHDCPGPMITRDTINIVCADTPIGEVRVQGRFLDRRGQFWNRADVHPRETVVVVAVVTVLAGGRETFRSEVEWTYWEGD